MAAPHAKDAQGVLKVSLSGTVSAGELVGYNSGWVRADADARIPAQFMAMEDGVSGDVRAVCKSGLLEDTDAPYTAGEGQYLSATAGAITATIPAVSSTLTVIQRVGVALSTSVVAFDLNLRGPYFLRASAAVNPASGATDTVQNLAVTITGVLSTDYAKLASAPTVVQGVIYNGSVVCTTDTVTVGIANASAGTVDGASTTVEFLVTRFAL